MSTARLVPIHPFPARMAPELVLDQLELLPTTARVLDPMTGSGTVLRACVERGLSCHGYDMDPLAVLMARVWTSKLGDQLEAEAKKVVQAAKEIREPTLPSTFMACAETKAFADFWFEAKQQADLAALSSVILTADGPYQDAFRLALSRIIITKENGASVARDTSHSRPHRVFFKNKFCVFTNFVLAARRISERHRTNLIIGNAYIEEADARNLPSESGVFDAVITSPPYLNAIDYMRGHRLALIWLGYGLRELRNVRSGSIGAEHGLLDEIQVPDGAVDQWDCMLPKHQKMVRRYVKDINVLMAEMKRVLKPGGSALVVVGNSTLKGVNVSNARINVHAAGLVGLTLEAEFERPLPSQNRYLPVTASNGALEKRMRTETVLRFAA